MNISRFVKYRIDSGPAWDSEFCCPTRICADVDDRLRRIAPHGLTHACITTIAAQAIELVNHFEHDFDYVDFMVHPMQATGQNEDDAPLALRVVLAATPEPFAVITLSPQREGG